MRYNQPVGSEHDSIRKVVRVARRQDKLELTPDDLSRMDDAHRRLQALFNTGETIYGVSTGFGPLKSERISLEKASQLQTNLIRSHACGVGPPLKEDQTRAMMALLALSLSKGASGVPASLAQAVVDLLNNDIVPVVPSRGSLGASGDLAPLAHAALVLIGEGEAVYQGRRMPGREALSAAGLSPIELTPKCGLSLINGTHAHTGIACLLWTDMERLIKTAEIAAAMSIEAMLGSAKPFGSVARLKPHPGQLASSANLDRLLAGSAIVASHAGCAEVQDAYSMRCAPHVLGAARQTHLHLGETLLRELESVTDNPLLVDGEAVSAGHFHGQAVGFALDYAAMGLAEIASISERRAARILDASMSRGLPAFLVAEPGLNSGFMIAQYTAAALVSENKTLCHPASVDSIPTGANQEDHVSMAMTAALKATDVLKNAQTVVAIELLCAAQGLEFRKRETGLKAAKGTGTALEAVREAVPFLESDAPLAPMIEKVLQIEDVVERVEQAIGEMV